MTDQKDVTCFEFGDEQNRALSQLSVTLYRLGAAMLVAGALLVVYLAVSFVDPVPLLAVSDSRSTRLATFDYALWGLIALLVVYVSVRIARLAKPIRLTVETKGADIPYLMDFVTDLTGLARTCIWALVVISALIAVSLVLLVLVF
jgi:hypothetical protein